jgi:hypothetical protein
MSQTDQFWHYAKEAMLAALTPKPTRHAGSAAACADLGASGIPRATVLELVTTRALQPTAVSPSWARLIKTAAISSD